MDFRRRLSSGGESFSEGTSRFFSSVIAKKNGLMNDLSNKMESVGALMKTSSSGSSLDDTENAPVNYTPEDIDRNYRKEYENDSRNYTRKESFEDNSWKTNETAVTIETRPMPEDKIWKERENIEQLSSAINKHDGLPDRYQRQESNASSSGGSVPEEMFPKSGANMSFDEPIYSPSKISTNERTTTNAGIGPSWKGRNTPPQIAPPPYNPNKTNMRNSRSSTNSPKMSSGHSSDSEKYEKYANGDKNISDEKTRAPSLATTKRRSSTVDEMLFDDYVDQPAPTAPVAPVQPKPEPKGPEEDNVFNKRKTLLPMGDLISFDEPELEDFHPKQIINRRNLKNAELSGDKSFPSVSSIDSSEIEFGESSFNNQTSVDSSEPEYERTHSHRLNSMGSERSWSSNYSLDSQPDDLTLECMGFMKEFVSKIFSGREDISQTDKAKFGEYCQQVPGRQWFARYVNTQRAVSKKVEESIFFRLVQYFAVMLFECHEAEDYVPGKNLMNMCFTFYHESRQGKQRYKNYLYSYLREQPIWQSLRFWNAAFFDAVQNERARKPVCTSEDGHDSQTDDSMFQENITFGQLGTFTCNMRAFGLSKELCLEFIRKQSTIANLKHDQVRMLKENVEKWKDH